jgi:hypothetical protein
LGDNQDSSKAAADDTWAGKEKASGEEKEVPCIKEDDEKEQRWE